MLSMLYAIAYPSVCLSVTRVDQSNAVKLGSCNFYHNSPIPLVFAGAKIKNLDKILHQTDDSGQMKNVILDIIIIIRQD